jgi:hypothetical protein
VIGETEATEPKTAPAPHSQRLKDKLHAWLYALVDRLRKKAAAGPNESKFVHDGKAEIVVSLSSSSAAAIEKLRKAGLEIVSEKGNILTGRISIEKLAGLADMNEIKLILPNA